MNIAISQDAHDKIVRDAQELRDYVGLDDDETLFFRIVISVGDDLKPSFRLQVGADDVVKTDEIIYLDHEHEVAFVVSAHPVPHIDGSVITLDDEGEGFYFYNPNDLDDLPIDEEQKM